MILVEILQRLILAKYSLYHILQKELHTHGAWSWRWAGLSWTSLTWGWPWVHEEHSTCHEGVWAEQFEDSTSHTATKAELSELNPSGRDPQAHRSNQWPTRVYLVISCCSGPLMLHSSYQMIPVSIHTQTHVERKEERKEVRERGQRFNCWPRRAGESRGKATSTNCEESREWKERVKERKKIKTKGSDSGFRVSHLIIRPVSS